MKILAPVLLVVAAGAFTAAVFLGATPAAARLTNVGLALVSVALLVEVVPL